MADIQKTKTSIEELQAKQNELRDRLTALRNAKGPKEEIAKLKEDLAKAVAARRNAEENL